MRVSKAIARALAALLLAWLGSASGVASQGGVCSGVSVLENEPQSEAYTSSEFNLSAGKTLNLDLAGRISGDAVNFVVECPPRKGILEETGDGTFTYTPQAGEGPIEGRDKTTDVFSFTYEKSGKRQVSACEIEILRVNVGPPNSVEEFPVSFMSQRESVRFNDVENQDERMQLETTPRGDLSPRRLKGKLEPRSGRDNEGDLLVYKIEEAPKHGMVWFDQRTEDSNICTKSSCSQVESLSGVPTFNYVPDPSVKEPKVESFKYTVSDCAPENFPVTTAVDKSSRLTCLSREGTVSIQIGSYEGLPPLNPSSNKIKLASFSTSSGTTNSSRQTFAQVSHASSESLVNPSVSAQFTKSAKETLNSNLGVNVQDWESLWNLQAEYDKEKQKANVSVEFPSTLAFTPKAVDINVFLRSGSTTSSVLTPSSQTRALLATGISETTVSFEVVRNSDKPQVAMKDKYEIPYRLAEEQIANLVNEEVEEHTYSRAEPFSLVIKVSQDLSEAGIDDDNAKMYLKFQEAPNPGSGELFHDDNPVSIDSLSKKIDQGSKVKMNRDEEAEEKCERGENVDYCFQALFKKTLYYLPKGGLRGDPIDEVKIVAINNKDTKSKTEKLTLSVPCPRGFRAAQELFSSKNGLEDGVKKEHTHHCAPCNSGYFQGTKDETSCRECQLGSFALRKAQSECTLCPEDTYQDESGQVACKECPFNQVHPNSNSTKVSKTLTTGATKKEDCICRKRDESLPPNGGLYGYYGKPGSNCWPCEGPTERKGSLGFDDAYALCDEDGQLFPKAKKNFFVNGCPRLAGKENSKFIMEQCFPGDACYTTNSSINVLSNQEVENHGEVRFLEDSLHMQANATIVSELVSELGSRLDVHGGNDNPVNIIVQICAMTEEQVTQALSAVRKGGDTGTEATGLLNEILITDAAENKDTAEQFKDGLISGLASTLEPLDQNERTLSFLTNTAYGSKRSVSTRLIRLLQRPQCVKNGVRQGSECRELLMATPCAKGLALTGSCSVGYTGAGCRSCAENYFRLNGQCSKCPENANVVFGAVLFAMIAFLSPVVVSTLGNVDWTGLAKIIGFMQILNVINAKLKFPPALSEVLDALSILNINIEFIHPDCVVGGWDFFNTWAFGATIPLMAAALAAFIVGVLWFHSTLAQLLRSVITSRQWLVRSPPKSGGLKSLLMKIRKKFFLIWCNGLSRNMLIIITHYAIRSLLVLLHILYVPLTRIAFEVFDCQEDKLTGHEYLEREPSIRCRSEQWWNIFPYALVAVIGYPIGIHLLFSVLLYRARHDLYQPAVERTLSFVFDRFLQKYYAFELIIMARKSIVVALLVLIRGADDKVNLQRASAAMFVILTGMLIQFFVAPYSSVNLDRMELTGLFTEFYSLLVSMILLAPDLNSNFVHGLENASIYVWGLALIVSIFYMLLDIFPDITDTWGQLKQFLASRRRKEFTRKYFQFRRQKLIKKGVPAEEVKHKPIFDLYNLSEIVLSPPKWMIIGGAWRFMVKKAKLYAFDLRVYHRRLKLANEIGKDESELVSPSELGKAFKAIDASFRAQEPFFYATLRPFNLENEVMHSELCLVLEGLAQMDRAGNEQMLRDLRQVYAEATVKSRQEETKEDGVKNFFHYLFRRLPRSIRANGQAAEQSSVPASTANIQSSTPRRSSLYEA